MEAKSSSNGGEEEVAIFTDTNMATHIALAVSPHFTTCDFQKEVERMHFSCFPKLGRVEACKVMVKRRACFYCLPKSLPIKYAFRGLEKPWFLHVEMRPLSCLEKHIAKDYDVHISDDCNVAGSITGNTEMNDMVLSYKEKCLTTILVKPEKVLDTCPFSKKKRKKKKCVDKCLGHGAGGDSHEKCRDARDGISDFVPLASTTEREKKFPGFLLFSRSDFSGSISTSSAATESQLETHLEAKSDRNFSKRQICAPPHFAVGTPTKNLHPLQPKKFTHKSSRNEFGMKTKVGKRILSAAYKLKVSRNKQRPSTYLFRSSLGASPGIASAIFEISDSDD